MGEGPLWPPVVVGAEGEPLPALLVLSLPASVVGLGLEPADEGTEAVVKVVAACVEVSSPVADVRIVVGSAVALVESDSGGAELS